MIPPIIERTVFEDGDFVIFEGANGNFDLDGGETGERRGVLVPGTLIIFG